MYRITAGDLQSRLLLQGGGQADQESVTKIRLAIRTALRMLSAEHTWPAYSDYMHIETSEAYTTGTIAYTASDRTVVLSGGTWPSWMSQGSLIIDTFHARVDAVASSTSLTVTSDDAPVDDYTGTFTAYQYQYSLPAAYNIYKVGKIMVDQANYLEYVPPELFETEVRRPYLVEGGRPRQFTLGRDFRNTQYSLLSLWPFPTTVMRLRMPYIRHPRDILVWEDQVGTVSTTASSTAVVGVDTVFASKHVGCALRTSSDRVNAPTSIDGQTPFVDEVVIKTVTDATNLVTASALGTTQSDVAITISDIIDADTNTMMEAVYHRARLELAKINRIEPNLRAEYEADYKQALYLAKCQASTPSGVRVAGQFRSGAMGWPGLWDSWYTIA